MAYIFDTSKGETPETVAQKRKLAETLAARIFGRTPQNVGEGLSTLGQAWVARTMLDEANEVQKAGSAAGNDAFSKISGMITGGPSQAQRQTGPSTQDLIAASTNPWLTESQRGVVNTMLKQRLEQDQQANDPLRQLQIRKAERDLAGGANPESVREYEYARGNGFEGSFSDWIASKRGGAGEYSLTPVYGKNEKGETVLIQPGKSGTAIQTVLPKGVTISSGVDKMDGGTHWILIDKKTGDVVGRQLKDVRGEEREKVAGKGEGEAVVSLDSIKSKMPGLEAVITDLDKLSEQATYTMAGQALNFAGRQLGLEPREAAIARTKYISTVDNQVLPLLRDIFGSAFTKAEGDALRNTLGDPDKSPKEKQAVLKSFIEQKRRDVEALERRVGRQSPAGAAPAMTGGQPTVDDLLKKYGSN